MDKIFPITDPVSRRISVYVSLFQSFHVFIGKKLLFLGKLCHKRKHKSVVPIGKMSSVAVGSFCFYA